MTTPSRLTTLLDAIVEDDALRPRGSTSLFGKKSAPFWREGQKREDGTSSRTLERAPRPADLFFTTKSGGRSAAVLKVGLAPFRAGRGLERTRAGPCRGRHARRFSRILPGTCRLPPCAILRVELWPGRRPAPRKSASSYRPDGNFDGAAALSADSAARRHDP